MRISDWSSDVCSSDLIIEHEPLQYPHIGRLDRLMRIERLRLFGIERGGVGADQPHAHRTKPRDDIASDRGAIRVPLPVWELPVSSQKHPHEIGRAPCRERACQYG